MPYNPNSIWGGKGKPYDPAAGQQDAPPATTANEQPVLQQPAGDASSDKGKDTSPSFFARHGLGLFTGGIILAIAAAAVIYYLLLPPAAPNISITFSDPGTVTVGEPFPLSIIVSNDSKNAIQDADLTITLPQGLSFVGNGTTPDQRALMEPIGALNAQTVNPPQAIKIIATDGAGSAKTITATLTYGIASSASAQFQKNTDTSVTIGTQSALALSYRAPSSIFSGQNFDLAVDYANTTGQSLQDVQLIMQYPPAYHYASSGSSTPIDAADTTWSLGDLAPNATGTLIITGNIVGPINAQYQLNGTLAAAFYGEHYPVVNAPANFAVAPSPLTLTLTVGNNSSSYISRTQDSLYYTLTYTNNSNVTFQTLNLRAALTGEMYDLSSLKTSGAFNSQNNTITWYAANTPGLAALSPGQSGSVNFSINTKKSFPIRLPSNKDYTLAVSAQIQSPTVPANTAGSSTVSVASLSTKIAGEIDLSAAGYVKETAVPSFKNSGPYPPKVNQPTTYTIHWSLKNYATDMKNVTVSAYLQSGTTFTGAVTSTVPSSTPAYNAATGLITWTIPSIPATTGVISSPITAVFQVSNTPAVNQVGQQVTLLGQTTLTTTDGFTGQAVNETAPAIITQFPNDPSVSQQQGSVTQ